jgi:hypothetical protein
MAIASTLDAGRHWRDRFRLNHGGIDANGDDNGYQACVEVKQV